MTARLESAMKASYGRLGDRLVLFDGAAGDADGADDLLAGCDGDAAGKRDDPAVVGDADAVQRAAGLGLRIQILRRGVERCATAIEPSQAPSCRANAARLLPASTTATFIATPISSALARPAATTVCACCRVMP